MTPLVSAGDVLDLLPGQYLQGESMPEDPLSIRVVHLPEGAATWSGDWLALTGTRDGTEIDLVVHRKALPGYQAPLLRTGSLTW